MTKIYRFLEKAGADGRVTKRRVLAFCNVLRHASEQSGEKSEDAAVKAFTYGLLRACDAKQQYTEGEFVHYMQFADSFSSIDQAAAALHVILTILENVSAEEGLKAVFLEAEAELV